MLREPQETPGSPRRPQEAPWRPQEAPEGPHADSACVFYVCAYGLPFSCGSNPMCFTDLEPYVFYICV